MPNNKVDFSKIKEELDNRKKNIAETATAENLPKDNFLFELSNSLRSGSESRATERIKLIEDKTAVKNNERPVHNVNSNVQVPSQRQPIGQQPKRPVFGEEFDREEQMFNDLNTKQHRNAGMSEVIGEYTGQSNKQPNRQYGAGNMLNEEVLNEAVIKSVNRYLGENLETILSEVIKDTMLEIFAKDRIKTVINEDKEAMKKMVIEAIRELQQKNKK